MANRKSGHVTLQDIAQACGFSVSTVSIVLSDAPLSRHVAEATRQRVRTMAKQLGYHPDAYARSLRNRRSQTIGVLAYDLTDPYCLPIMHGIQSGLLPAKFMPLLMDAQSRRELFDNYLRTILERRAEGLIVVASWIFEEENLLADIAKNRVPIVIVGRDLSDRNLDSILVDNQHGGALALEHLHRLGHRDIAIIRGPEELFDSEPRWRGIQRAASELDIHLDNDLVRQLPGSLNPSSSFEGGRQLCIEMLATNKPFTAVLAFDDVTAFGVIRAIEESGRKVPHDISVLGFDDILPASMMTPSLSTIHQPLQEMGSLAAEWLLGRLDARDPTRQSKARIFMATPQLIARSTTEQKNPPRNR